jgi:integrase
VRRDTPLYIGQILDRLEAPFVAKSVRNAKLDSKAARAKLASSPKPYFISIDEGLHLGYRKGERTRQSSPKRMQGRWVGRRYLGDEKYVVEPIGLADDFSDADGVEILTFHQAVAKARERAHTLTEEARIASLGPAVTVRGAIEEYIDARDVQEIANRSDGGSRVPGSKGLKKDARSRLKHVLSDERLAAKPLAALTDGDLAGWRKKLQMRPASEQRVVNDLKAALNGAARNYKGQLPADIRDTIRDGLARVGVAPAATREAQVLPDTEVRAIVSAAQELDAEGGWEGDLACIVLALAATGARFSQLIRMVTEDVQPEQKRLMVPTSRKGRGEKQKKHTAVPVGDDVLAALVKAKAGRKGGLLFLRPHWRQIGPAKWEKGERGPWFAAAELRRPWAAVIARAGLAPGTIPYALRHSSIVRGLRFLPVSLVAKLHDTSTGIVEKHYGHFIDDSLGELAARAVVPLTTAPHG